MSKSKTLNRMLGVATLAMMFGAGSACAQSSASDSSVTSRPSAGTDANTKDGAGKTSENRAGRMSATGENETTSATAKPGASSGGSASSGQSASGAASTSGDSSASSGQSASGSSASGAKDGPDAHTKDGAGKTRENRAGRMSPTGENETTSVKAKTKNKNKDKASGSSAGASASGQSASGAPEANTKDGAGKTNENRAGRMSATGENETTSATPAAGGSSSSGSSPGSSGTSK